MRPRADGTLLKHADSLYVLARENGFASWPVLKTAVETHGMDKAQRLRRLKVALLNGREAVMHR